MNYFTEFPSSFVWKVCYNIRKFFSCNQVTQGNTYTHSEIRTFSFLYRHEKLMNGIIYFSILTSEI